MRGKSVFAVVGIVLLAALAPAARAQSPSTAQAPATAGPPPFSRPAMDYFRAHPDAWNAFVQQWESQRNAPHAAAAVPAFNPPSGGTWTALNHLPGGGGVALSNPLLLTDGTVIAHVSCTRTWWRLTPDINGSYVNGTWTTIASLPTGYDPRFFASAVLPDGRVLIEGGEYNNSTINCNNNNAGVWTNLGAIYDPVANSWSSVSPPSGWTQIGDAQSIILANGTFMVADCCDPGPLAATFNEQNFLNHTTPVWTSTGTNKFDSYDEEGWTLLPDSTVLTVDAYTDQTCAKGSERYTPSDGQWATAGNTSTVQLPDCDGPVASDEMGPQVLRPDGTVVAFGGTTTAAAAGNVTGAAHTAIFDSSNSTWSAGPDIPSVSGTPYTLADAPAVLLPNGNILFAASPSDWTAPNNEFLTPTNFFELSSTNVMSEVTNADPTNTGSLNSYEINFLALPTGEVLMVETDSAGIKVYDPSPAGPGNQSWVPVITSGPPSTLSLNTTYQITGTQFNGLSQASVYGDDVQAATNYPLVRITNNATGHVFYARTFGFTNMSVAPSASGTTSFTLAANTESGPSQLVVIANGIASQPTNVTINGLYTLTVTKSGSGGGTVTSSPSGINCGATCSANFTSGQQVTLTAAPVGGSFFAGWSGGGCSGLGTCTVTMSAAVAVTATFDPGFVLTVSEIGDGVVSTSSGTPAAINCGSTCSAGFASGTVVTVNEVPGSGWTFHGWGGACAGTGTCQVTMSLARSVSAVFTATSSVAGNTWAYTCTNSSADHLNSALAGSASWTFPSSTGTPGAGDIILLNGICLGDVTVTTPDLIFTNHNDTNPSGSAPPSSASGFVDGIDGQLEFATGAAASTARNLLLEGPSSFSGGESANLYVHDGGAATVQNSWIGPGPLDGIVVQGAPSTVTLLNSTVNGNGTANAADAANGARVIEAGSLVLGAADGSNGSMISGNSNGFGIALLGNASAELNGSTVSNNGLGQLDAIGSSSLRLAGTQVTQASGSTPAIQTFDRSTLSLVTLASGTGDTITSGNAGAVLAAAVSEVVLHGATVQSSSPLQPTIEISAGSAAILAGGNTIGNSATGGSAVEIDHSSSLIHERGSQLGFANAAEAITGGGSVQMQSSIDLGQGLVSSNAGIAWTLSGSEILNVQQNSSFRLSGGVTIAGGSGVKIQQGSNAFINFNNGGSNSATIICTNSANNPMAHVANPADASSVTTYTLNDVLNGVSGAAHPGQTNACLNF